MKPVTKLVTGAVSAALLSVTLAAPAAAQYRDRYERRGDGIDVGDIIQGAVVIGGVVAAADAIGNAGRGYGRYDRYDRYDRYGRYDRYDRYGRGEEGAIRACAYEAERYGRGRVQITDVDRRGYNGYRVRGVISGGYDRYDRGYDRRYDRDYGRYDYDRRDRDSFTCTARSDGRITDFRLRDR
jgi:hypothetical protein